MISESAFVCVAIALLCAFGCVMILNVRIRELEEKLDILEKAVTANSESLSNHLRILTLQGKTNDIVYKRFESTNKWIKSWFDLLAFNVNTLTRGVNELEEAHELLAQTVMHQGETKKEVILIDDEGWEEETSERN